MQGKTKNSRRSKSSAKRKRRKGGLGLGPLVVGGVVLALALVASLVAFKGYSGESQWVEIPEAASVEEVRDSLTSSLGSSAGWRVYAVWRAMGGNPSRAYGSYRVDPGQSAFSVARRLRSGRQTPILLSWSGGRTMDDLAKKVSRRFSFTAEDFLESCDELLPKAGFKKEEFPAAFLPDTYEFYWTATSDDVVRRLLEYRNRFWNAERRDKARRLGLTPVGVTTIASIVEEESSKHDEYGKIGRLYLNRYQRGMKLQADPTVKFAIGDFGIRRILHEHLRVHSPYNTYEVVGLPPGPIRVVAASTIDAVLDSKPHDYIYMCAREDFSGYHNFTSDYSEHLENARRYQSELNRRAASSLRPL